MQYTDLTAIITGNVSDSIITCASADLNLLLWFTTTNEQFLHFSLVDLGTDYTAVMHIWDCLTPNAMLGPQTPTVIY